MANQLNGLKTINNLQRDGSLQNLLLSIKNSKLELDTFSKKLQEKKQILQAKLREEEKVKAEENLKHTIEEKQKETPIVTSTTSKPIEEKKEFKPGENKNNFRKFDNKFDKDKFQNRNFAGAKPQNKPPFNKNAQQKNGNKPFVSTKANNYKSFAPTESSAVLAQPERNFGNKNKRRNVEETKKQNQKQKNMERYAGKDNNIYVLDDENGFEETIMGSRKLIKKKKEVQTVIAPKITHAVLTSREITIKDLSEKIGKPVSELVKKCMLLGIMATINSTIDFDTA